MFERYERHKELFADLYALRYRFMAYHGTSAGEPFVQLQATLNKVFVAARMLSMYWSERSAGLWSDEERQRRSGEIREQERIFWYMGSQDVIVPEVDATVTAIEALCRPIIQQAERRESLWQRLRP